MSLEGQFARKRAESRGVMVWPVSQEDFRYKIGDGFMAYGVLMVRKGMAPDAGGVCLIPIPRRRH